MIVNIVTNFITKSIRINPLNFNCRVLEKYLTDIKFDSNVNNLDITFESDRERITSPTFIHKLADNLYVILKDDHLKVIKDRYAKHSKDIPEVSELLPLSYLI